MGDKINAGRPIRIVEGGPIGERVGSWSCNRPGSLYLGSKAGFGLSGYWWPRGCTRRRWCSWSTVSILPDAVGRIAFGSGEDDIRHEGVGGQIVDVGDAGTNWEG